VAVQQEAGSVWQPVSGAPLWLVSVTVGPEGAAATLSGANRQADVSVRRLADELEIWNLDARVSQLTDDGDPDANCFAEDARWEIAGEIRRRRADITAGLVERGEIKACGPDNDSRHLVTTLAVHADGTDTARAESTWLFCTELRTAPMVRGTGRYSDKIVRTDDGCQVPRRRVTLDTTG
jgi:hypothetical protein